MKRLSQRPLQSFIDLQTRLIINAGGIPCDGIYTYALDTRGGSLRIKPFGDWVACRFDDLKLAGRAGVPFNPLNGKCNFHDAMTADGAHAFEEFLGTLKPAIEEIT